MFIDSHCHLDDPQFDADREAAIDRALAAGVDRMMVVGADTTLADRYGFIYAAAGVHPHDASGADFKRIEQLLRHPKVLALGEIGLDYHYDFSPREVQREVFETQLRMAEAAGKPVVIHTREAWDDTFRILGRGNGILHCFTGGPEEARQALDLGWHLSFGGIVTFPNAHANREAAALVPDDRLLIETDAPYLAPVPRRGKRNEPAFLPETARELARIRGCDVSHIAAVTTRNFERLCLRGGSGSG
jgi:TatD DNase family protein